MLLAVLFLRLLLAAVFLVAGVAKLVDVPGTRASLRDFAAPGALVPVLAWLLPIAELACALTLLTPAWAWWGAAGAAALLVVFTVGIGVTLLKGRRPACHCFGQFSSEAVGAATLGRNAFFLGAALFILSQRTLVPLSGSGALGSNPAVTVLALALVAQTVVGVTVLLHVLRQNGRLLLRVDALEAKLGLTAAEPINTGLPLGAAAPAFTATDLDGQLVTGASLERPGKRLLLIFSEADCPSCEALLPDVSTWQKTHAANVTVALVSAGAAAEVRTKIGTLPVAPVLLQRNRAVADAFGVIGTPSAVLIERGRIASPLAAGGEAIRQLVSEAARPVALAVGDGLPPLELRRLDAGVTGLRDLAARDTMLLFWNPGCGYCQGMLDDVKAWERARGDGRALIVIAAGSPAANREQGFASPVLLDPKSAAAEAFGVAGTPALVMLDAARRIAAPPFVGAPRVLEALNAAVLAVR